MAVFLLTVFSLMVLGGFVAVAIALHRSQLATVSRSRLFQAAARIEGIGDVCTGKFNYVTAA